MFCKNCGKEVEEGKDLCDVCQSSANTTVAEPEIAEQVYVNKVQQGNKQLMKVQQIRQILRIQMQNLK